MDQQVLTRGQTRWLRLGLFQSIHPTIKYQPGKANVIANALSRSQHKLEEGSTNDVATVAAMIERHVFSIEWIECRDDCRGSSAIDKGLQGRQGPHCGIHEATSRTKIRGFLSYSISSNGENDGGSTENCHS